MLQSAPVSKSDKSTRRVATEQPSPGYRGALGHYWYPVAAVTDVGQGPIGVTLLGQPIVLFRSGGTVHALRDLCIHRGTQLSLGWVDEEECLRCPYHGWRYAPSGKCVYIPSQPSDNQHIPPRAVVTRYACEERYDLVWVALEEAIQGLPSFPEYADAEMHTFLVGRWTWNASAGRVVENLIDTSHFPFVHPVLLGDPSRTEIAPFLLEGDDGGIHLREHRTDAEASHFDEPGAEIERETWVTFPFTWRIRITSRRGVMVVFIAVQPIEEGRCSFSEHVSRNYMLDTSDAEIGRFNEAVLEQDRRIVENQHPEMLPLDLSEELHLKVADAASLKYRKSLKAVAGTGYA